MKLHCQMCGTPRQRHSKSERIILGKEDPVYISVCSRCFFKVLKAVKYYEDGRNVIIEENDK